MWITEPTWQDAVDAARAVVPPDAEVTLLYVTAADVTEAPEGALAGLLGRGRRPPPRDPRHRIAALSEGAARELLAEAGERLGRAAGQVYASGRPEREVVAAAAAADLLVLGRGGDERPGPRSLAPPARFVVDHAPCDVLLARPDARATSA